MNETGLNTDISNQNSTPGIVYHSVNPFIAPIVEYIQDSRYKKQVGHSWQDVVGKDGVINKQKILVLGEKKVVDKQEYAKVYMGEIQRFFGLSKSSLKLLDYIMTNIKYGEDRICIWYPDVKEKLGMIKTTMYASIRQMIATELIARASTPGCYYINPAVIFKGERLAIVKQFSIDSIPNQYELDTIQEEYIPTEE